MLIPSLLIPCLAWMGMVIGGDERDTINLWSGKKIHGRVLLELHDKILVQVGTIERWIERDQIFDLETVAKSHREILEALRTSDRDSVKDLVALARDSLEHNLPHESRLLYWRVLLRDATNAGAHRALGHKKRRGKWLVKEGRKWRSFESVKKARKSWKDAWDLRSEHFQVRCDTGLEGTLNTLFELEYFYATFYQLFQRDLELREVLEPIQVYVYRDQKQFPSLSNNIGAWYSVEEEILYTWMKDDGQPFALFHEGTHALMHEFTAGATRGQGQLPGWLNEAWAEYMQTVLVSERPGCADLRVGWINQTHLEMLYESREEHYGLHRVLNFKSSDFAASTKQNLKYAQSYALFAHMLDGSKEKYRQRFLGYLRDALAGKGQASTFRKIFAKDLEPIERLYTTTMGLRWK